MFGLSKPIPKDKGAKLAQAQNQAPDSIPGMFKPGEQLTITGMAYRDGRPIMINLKIVRANGEDVRIGATEQGFYDDYLKKFGNDPKRRTELGKAE